MVFPFYTKRAVKEGVCNATVYKELFVNVDNCNNSQWFCFLKVIRSVFYKHLEENWICLVVFLRILCNTGDIWCYTQCNAHASQS